MPTRLLSLSAAFLLLSISAPALAEVKEGSRASDFTLKDLKGKTVKLSSFRGKVVVIDFWASWCAPCKKEMPALEGLAKKYADDGVAILAINIDKDRANSDKFLASQTLKHMRVLLDPSGNGVASQYDLPSMPTSYVVDKKGIVRHRHGGYNSGDEKKVAKEIDALLAK